MRSKLFYPILIGGLALAINTGCSKDSKKKRSAKTEQTNPIDPETGIVLPEVKIVDADNLATKIQGGSLTIQFEVTGTQTADFGLYCTFADTNNILTATETSCNGLNSHTVQDLKTNVNYTIAVRAVHSKAGKASALISASFTVGAGSAPVEFPNLDEFKKRDSDELTIGNPNGLDVDCSLVENKDALEACESNRVRVNFNALTKADVLNLSFKKGTTVVYTEMIVLSVGGIDPRDADLSAEGLLTNSRNFDILIPEGFHLLTYATDQSGFLDTGKRVRVFRVLDDLMTPPPYDCLGYGDYGRVVTIANPIEDPSKQSVYTYCETYEERDNYRERTKLRAYNVVDFATDSDDFFTYNEYERFQFLARDEISGGQVPDGKIFDHICQLSYGHGDQKVQAIMEYWNPGALIPGVGARPVDLNICLTTIGYGLDKTDVWVVNFVYDRKNASVEGQLELNATFTPEGLRKAYVKDTGRDPGVNWGGESAVGYAIQHAAMRIRSIVSETAIGDADWGHFHP
jgi:hypothetical protein